MIDNNTYNCCYNFNQKIIFSSDEYEWKICENCDLIYSLNNNDKFKKVRKTHFNNFKVAGEKGKNEFLSILNKLKKYSNLSNLTFFDFGCADGIYLKIADKYFKKVQGMEPNPFLKDRAIKKKLDILDNNFLDKYDLYYDVIFTRNTFEYVSNFSVSLNKLMNRINKNGYFIWRDKYYDYYPKNYSDKKLSSITNSFPTKNAILYHLSINKIEILEAHFYLNKSFLIIGQKKEKVNKIYRKKLILIHFFIIIILYVILFFIFQKKLTLFIYF